jgi:anti-sigma factor RsiW
MKCGQIEPLLPLYVDGAAAPGEQALVDEHLRTCAACRLAVSAQRGVRQVMAARGASLCSPAPPGMQTRLQAAMRDELTHAAARSALIGWRGQLSAFAAAAVVVLAIGTALVPVVTGRSSVVLAAQLVLDHLKCFAIDGDANLPAMAPADAAGVLRREYGWSFPMPVPTAASGATLVAVRRCLYGEGRAAHLLYRQHGEPISLFVLPGVELAPAELGVFGHEQIVWSTGGRTYMLVGTTSQRQALGVMASELRNGAE